VLARISARVLPPGPWRWTDDTAMARSIVGVLRDCGRIDQDELVRRFREEYRRDPARGYGRGAAELLSSEGSWRAAARSLFAGSGSQGNGAAMRAAPIGAFFAPNLALVVEQARLSAVVTHAHPEGAAGAIAVAVAAACFEQPEHMLETAWTHTPPGATRDGLHRALHEILDTPLQAAAALGSGQQVLASDTVPFALWCASRYFQNYERALWATVSGLGDRDTTCAIVGGIVGLVSSPPDDWLALRESLG
jgi:ADP-ribosylglycohydrolase